MTDSKTAGANGRERDIQPGVQMLDEFSHPGRTGGHNEKNGDETLGGITRWNEGQDAVDILPS
jgi:hypothetical protein